MLASRSRTGARSPALALRGPQHRSATFRRLVHDMPEQARLVLRLAIGGGLTGRLRGLLPPRAEAQRRSAVICPVNEPYTPEQRDAVTMALADARALLNSPLVPESVGERILRCCESIEFFLARADGARVQREADELVAAVRAVRRYMDEITRAHGRLMAQFRARQQGGR